MYPVVPSPFVEETLLFSLNGLVILVKNQLNVNIRVCFIQSIYVSDLMSVPHYFDYCSFVVRFENGCVSPPACSFSRLFWYSGSPAFSCEFQEQFVHFCKIDSYNFDRDFVESMD